MIYCIGQYCENNSNGCSEGLVRGGEVVDTGAPISVPVGNSTLGRILNVVGEPVDEKGKVSGKEKRPIP